MNKKDRALVVLSGGQDSTTCLFWAKANYDEVHAVTFSYGQKHSLELVSAMNVAKIAGVASHETVFLPAGVLSSTSPLVNASAPLEKYTDHASMEAIIGDRVEKTFVPMRNALFLTLAANRAVCLEAGAIVTGVCQADNANYPDCRMSFLSSQQSTISRALGIEEEVLILEAPLMYLSKAESVRMALNLSDEGASLAWPALAFTHTAYDGVYPPTGRDHASVLRAHGFEEAGYPDPLVVRAWNEGLMELPDTANYKRHAGSMLDLAGRIDVLKSHHALEA